MTDKKKIKNIVLGFEKSFIYLFIFNYIEEVYLFLALF